MSVLKTLDVAIGVVFLYLLLSFVASAIVELVAQIFRWRSRMLQRWIRQMFRYSLVDADKVLTNPLVRTLRDGNRSPSYIPAATFSAAVLYNLAAKTGGVDALSPTAALDAIASKLRSEPRCNGDAARALLETTLLTQEPSVPAIRFALEKWFNDTMDRASGQYKRRTRGWLFSVGLLIAFAGNVDTIVVTRWLWSGDDVRKAVVTAASDYARTHPLAPPANPQPEDAAKPPEPRNLSEFATRVVDLDRYVEALHYPIGSPRDQPFVQFLIGGLITALAVAIGSTFWFDALQSLIKIRSTGPKPGPR